MTKWNAKLWYKNLYALSKIKNTTLKNIEKEIDISEGYLSKSAKSLRTLNIDLILKVTNSLNISLTDMLTKDFEKQQNDKELISSFLMRKLETIQDDDWKLLIPYTPDENFIFRTEKDLYHTPITSKMLAKNTAPGLDTQNIDQHTYILNYYSAYRTYNIEKTNMAGPAFIGRHKGFIIIINCICYNGNIEHEIYTYNAEINKIEPICHTDKDIAINNGLEALYTQIREKVEHIEISDNVRDIIS